MQHIVLSIECSPCPVCNYVSCYSIDKLNFQGGNNFSLTLLDSVGDIPDFCWSESHFGCRHKEDYQEHYGFINNKLSHANRISNETVIIPDAHIMICGAPKSATATATANTTRSRWRCRCWVQGATSLAATQHDLKRQRHTRPHTTTRPPVHTHSHTNTK